MAPSRNTRLTKNTNTATLAAVLAVLVAIHAVSVSAFKFANYVTCMTQNVPNTCPQSGDAACAQSLAQWVQCTQTQPTDACRDFNYLQGNYSKTSEFNVTAATQCITSCASVIGASQSDYFKTYVAGGALSCAENGIPPRKLPGVQNLTSSKLIFEECQQKCACTGAACDAYFNTFYECVDQNSTDAQCYYGQYFYKHMIYESQPVPYSTVACYQSCRPDNQSQFFANWKCQYESCLQLNWTYPGPQHPEDGSGAHLKFSVASLIGVVAVVFALFA